MSRIIRIANPADLPVLITMIRALSGVHGDTAKITDEGLHEILFGSGARAFALIAEQDGMPVGYAGIIRIPTLHSGVDRFDIQHLFVSDGQRGKGVGKALIAQARDIAKAAGAKGLTIGPAPQNTAAQATYRAMGYAEVTGVGPRFWIPCDDEARRVDRDPPSV